MKKSAVLITLVLLSLKLTAQSDSLYSRAYHTYRLYSTEAKSLLKPKADSLLNQYLQTASESEPDYLHACIMTLATGAYAARSVQFDTVQVAPKIKSQPLFQAFKNTYALKAADFETNQNLHKALAQDSLVAEREGGDLKAEYFAQLTEMLYNLRQYALAETYGNRALQLITEENRYEPVQLHRMLGGIYYQTGNRKKAIGHFKQCYDLAIDEDLKDSNVISSIAWNMGALSYSNSRYEEALPYLIESAKHYEIANGNTPYLISRYALLADCYFYTSQFKKAQIAGLKAKSLAQDVIKTDDVYLNGLVASSLSRIYAAQGKFDEARALLKPTLQNTLEAYGEASSLSAAFTGDLAQLEARAGNLDTAEVYFKKALDIAKGTDRIYTNTAALTELIGFYNGSDQLSKAAPYIDEEKSLLVQNKDTTSVIFYANRFYKIRALIAGGDYEEARQLLQERSEGLAKLSGVESSHIENLMLSLSLKQKQYEATKDRRYLEEAMNELDTYIEKMIRQKSSLTYDASKIFYGDQVSDQIPVALDLIYEDLHEHPTAENYTRALRFMEINKGSALLDGLKASTLAKTYGVDEQLLVQQDTIKSALEALNKKLNTEEATETRAALIDQELALQRQEEALNAQLKENYPRYYQASTLSLSETSDYYRKNLLEPGEMVLEYFLADDDLYLLQLSKEEVSLQKMTGAQELKSRVEHLYLSLKERASYEEDIDVISAILLPELPNSLKRLTIISDDVLGSIPFELLKVNGEMLIQYAPIRYAGSLQLLDEQVKLKTNSGITWLGFAPEYANASLNTNIEEVTRIAEKIKGEAVTGTAATKAQFKKQQSDYSILHLATHGRLDEINPMNNSLLFADTDPEADAELSVLEIYGLQLNASLAVLSACNTGSGKYEKGDGVMSLSRAFNYAGVSSTLVSLWQVPDRETSQIMTAFYDYLKEGKAKDVALQLAKQEYLKNTTDEALKHPYYWAGFVISGDVSPVTSTSYVWVWLVILLLAFSGLFFWFRKRKN